MKKVKRSTRDRVFYGVIGGIAEYYKTDSRILRLLYAIFTISSGVVPGIVIYLIAALVITEH